MRKIAIDIDAENRESKTLLDKAISASPQQLGILSSITLTPKLRAAIEAGYNSVKGNPSRDASGYNLANISANGRALVSGDPAHGIPSCQFVVAVGGSIVHSAISASSSVSFVSLVGAIPVNVSSSCLGGVSLESWASNRDRVAILLAKLGTPTPPISSIVLYYNPASKMCGDEEADWDAFNPPVAGAVTRVPTTNNFQGDFTGISPNVQGLVISADPFFQDHKSDLVNAANAWVSTAGTNRYVVYPLQIYGEVAPIHGKTTLYGPDLYQAYFRLGQLARSASDNQAYVGFERALNLTAHV